MKHGVVLMNLGTPDAPTPSAIRRYLQQFLSDPRVVELPRWLWFPILFGPLSMFRPAKVAPGYQMMWQEYGDSPLRVISRRQTDALRERLAALGGDAAPAVALAMSYGNPSLPDALAELHAKGVEQVLLIPLYPQYSATTTGAIYDQVAAIVRTSRDIPAIHVVKSYYQYPRFTAALATSVQRYWLEHGKARKLLLSFHGIPQRNVDLGDPYYAHCVETARALAVALALDDTQWAISFQSRLGRARWLQPYTSELLREWGAQGVTDVDVICPAFAADCLETLEEIAVENRAIFEQAGGRNYRYIPCLNDSADQIDLLIDIIVDQMPGLTLDTRQRLLGID